MIKIPKTEKLKKNAFAYNRKAFRKTVIASIKYVSNYIKKISKSGKTRYEITVSDSQTHGYEYMIAFRWIRRFSGLNVTIHETEVDHDKKGRKYIDKIEVVILW